MDKMKKIIVYFPYKLRDQTSGSSVRPVKILEAFNEVATQRNCELIEIHGETKERHTQFEKLYKEVNPNDILFCYMENATIPLVLSDSDHIPRKPLMDYQFIKYLNKNNIPLGVFYRDIYWKFDSLYKVKIGIKQAMRSLFKMELAMYKKYAHTFFLPSIYMNEYVGADSKNVTNLPPGGTNKLEFSKDSITKVPNAIYVGGINPRYGIYDTLEAFKKLNETETLATLTLICRKEDLTTYADLINPYKDFSWINIQNAFGEQLISYYSSADIGIVPIKRDFYNDFAVAVKLFEYISFGLPVIATNCTAQKDLVEKSELGVVVDDNADGILKGLKELLNPQIRKDYKERVTKALLEEHLWIHRAEKVFETLSR
jgi:glycosyltransferase involved in cell wall biosynthesis